MSSPSFVLPSFFAFLSFFFSFVHSSLDFFPLPFLPSLSPSLPLSYLSSLFPFDCPLTLSDQVVPQAEHPCSHWGGLEMCCSKRFSCWGFQCLPLGTLTVHNCSWVAGEAAAWGSGEAAGPSQVTLVSDLSVNPTSSEFKKWILSLNLNCCLLLCLSVALSPGLGRNSVYICVSLHRGGNSGAKEEGFYSRLNSRVKHKEVKDKFQWCHVNCTVGKSWWKSYNLFLCVCWGVGPVWGQLQKSAKLLALLFFLLLSCMVGFSWVFDPPYTHPGVTWPWVQIPVLLTYYSSF